MDAVKNKPTTERRTQWIMTCLTAAERERIAQAAGKEGISLSSFVRRAVLRGLARGTHTVQEDWPEGAGR